MSIISLVSSSLQPASTTLQIAVIAITSAFCFIVHTQLFVLVILTVLSLDYLFAQKHPWFRFL